MIRSIIRSERGQHLGKLDWEECPGATYEFHLDVASDFHRRGIGRSMVVELETIVRERRGMCLYTFTAGDNEQAKAFFTALGFAPTYLPGFYGEGRHAYMFHKTVGKPS